MAHTRAHLLNGLALALAALTSAPLPTLAADGAAGKPATRTRIRKSGERVLPRIRANSPQLRAGQRMNKTGVRMNKPGIRMNKAGIRMHKNPAQTPGGRLKPGIRIDKPGIRMNKPGLRLKPGARIKPGVRDMKEPGVPGVRVKTDH